MSNENNPTCSLECGAEKQSSTAYKNQNTGKKAKICAKRNCNAYMREYWEKKRADETSAKTKHNAYIREYRKKEG